ncbi:MAG TPA: ECF transporter S component [Thermomicrobiales bacterium]|nr:ECF transporter S component [Thermomicrobiales bacterium]
MSDLHNAQSKPRGADGRSAQSWVMVAVASLVGMAAFLYPFLLPVLQPSAEDRARAGDAPVLFAFVTLLSLAAIALELDPARGQMGGMSASKLVALLGVLVAANAALRLVPTFLGASPLFALIVLVGAVFGPVFGFQMGALTLLVSAFLTGGIGPWLPFQMLGAGWVGLVAGWLPRPADQRRRLVVLAAFGIVTGFAYGAMLNLYTWPFAAPGAGQDLGLYWTPSLSAGEALQHYARFYLVTSLWYDAFRALANAALILLIGAPVLRTLDRSLAHFSWRPWTALPRQ